MHAVSIGDVFVDYISDLTNHFDVSEVGSGTNIFASIDVKIGGAGLQFAVEAKRAGFEVSTLIGKIGGRFGQRGEIIPDLPGSLAVEFLQIHEVSYLLAIDPNSETGRILLIYLPSDRRLMLSDPLANALLVPTDITPGMKTTIRQADLVHISGYTFLQQGRRAAVLEMARYANEGAANVALDVVPHDIYKSMSFEQLSAEAGGLFDWAIIEINTAHQLFGLGKLEQFSLALVDHLLKMLTAIFPSVVLHLNPGHAIVVDKGKRWEHKADYQPGVASRGQSARMQAELLYWCLAP